MSVALYGLAREYHVNARARDRKGSKGPGNPRDNKYVAAKVVMY